MLINRPICGALEENRGAGDLPQARPNGGKQGFDVVEGAKYLSSGIVGAKALAMLANSGGARNMNAGGVPAADAGTT